MQLMSVEPQKSQVQTIQWSHKKYESYQCHIGSVLPCCARLILQARVGLDDLWTLN